MKGVAIEAIEAAEAVEVVVVAEAHSAITQATETGGTSLLVEVFLIEIEMSTAHLLLLRCLPSVNPWKTRKIGMRRVRLLQNT